MHIFPHWNWKAGQTVDVWAYYNNADEAELFLNGKSLGTKKKMGDDLHVMWRVPYEPGTIKAVSRKNGKTVLEKTIHTAGPAAKLVVSADRNIVHAGGNDLCFVTVKVVDKNGNMVPDADHLIKFELQGNAAIAGVDNGSPVSMESFKANSRKAFNGMCLAVIAPNGKPGSISLKANAEGLSSASVTITAK